MILHLLKLLGLWVAASGILFVLWVLFVEVGRYREWRRRRGLS